MPAVLFGSISTLADTSELQRDAFNRAFADHGLDWRWEPEEYRAMLGTAGGRDRIAAYAAARGEDVDAAAVHATKSKLFQEALGAGGVTARPGVAATIRAARERGWKVALVTTTSPANVAALLGALSAEIGGGAFDVVTDATTVADPKPDPAAYRVALERLGEQAAAVAVEDNPDGVAAAAAAGVACVAFPNANTAGLEFPAAARRVEHLDLDELAALAGGA